MLLVSFNFGAEFASLLTKLDLDFEIRGLLTADDRIMTLDTDTKVLSTVFELFCEPLIRALAKDHDLLVEASKQTIYPDFTLMRGEGDRSKVAVDIKTTYRRADGRFGFTLGSYTSFLRDGRKNIRFPYDEYARHWVIGFVYDRSEPNPESVYPLSRRGQICSPYRNIETFVQEKCKIAGLLPGSGNTRNIGSIWSNDIEDFRRGRGPFALRGELYFREYWANFQRSKTGARYRTVTEFERWKSATGRKRRLTF